MPDKPTTMQDDKKKQDNQIITPDTGAAKDITEHEKLIDPGNEHHHTEAPIPEGEHHEPGAGPGEEPDHSGEDG